MQNKKTKVLVINDEPDVIDRRITHQLEVLAGAGYSVVFAKPEGKNDKEPFVPCGSYTMFNYPSTSKSVAFNKLSNKLSSSAFKTQFLNFEETRTKKISPALLHYFILILRGFCNAPLMASMIRNRIPGLKRNNGGYAIEVLVFLFLLRFDLLYRMAFYKFSAWKLRSKDTKPALHYFANFFQPDIIHGHDLPSMANALQIAENTDATLIMDAHEIYAGQFTYDKKRHQQQLAIEKSVLKSIDLLVSVNSYCLDYLQNEHGTIKETAVISNSVKLPDGFEFQDGKLWHDKFGLSPETKLIVFQGGINPLRSIDELVEGLVELPEHVHLGFITWAKDVAYYSALSRRLGVEHRIHYILEIDWIDVLSWLRAADFGIIPYQVTSDNAYAASPNKMYEFVSAGVPIIATSNLPQVKAFIEEYEIGVTCPFSDASSYAQGIKAAIEWLETEPNIDQKISRAALENDYSDNTKTLLRAYDRVLS